MLVVSKKRLIATAPLFFAAASCVPAPQAAPVQALAAVAAVPAAAAAPGFSFDILPPASSLAALPAAEEARWQKAAGLFDAPSATPAEPFAHKGGEDDRSRALDCLTAAVYYEARSESRDGQRAVAQVVLNRARHPAFPASVCGVVYQGSARRTGCQFSFTCDGSMARRRNHEEWARAREIAAGALGGEVFAPVGNATHYHTRAVLPYWASSLTRSTVIGAHIFYRWRGGAGRSDAFTQTPSGYEAWPIARAAALRARYGEAAAAPQVARVERVRTGGAVVRIHRGEDEAPAAAPQEPGFGVRVHLGASPVEAPAES